MTVLLRDGSTSDQTLPLIDVDEPVPAGPHALTLARWQADAPADAPAALALPNTEDPESLALPWKDLPAIWLEFPSFTDGRAYSQARVLRERIGFEGQILARGDVLQDQIFYLSRCGFDAFELRDDQSLEGCRAALAEFSTAYRDSTAAQDSIFRRRRQQGAAA